ncbi:MAG TPA: PaaX family transcriptional regulator [Acidimicrobiaceae bacterium]|nr:PaaX family transcriptional regulator [Acidimicrobiaceae bacterium]
MQNVAVGNYLSRRPLPQELLITLLGNQLLHHSSSRVSSIGLIQILNQHGFSVASTRSALLRLVKRGFLISHRAGRETHYSLSTRAKSSLIDGEHRIRTFVDVEDSPESEWTLLSYSLPVEHRSSRDRLRRRLTFLGYGNLRDGQWIAPGDRSLETDAVIRELELEQHVELFLGRPAITMDPSRMIAEAWGPLDQLGNLYITFSQKWDPAGALRRSKDDLFIRTLLMLEWRQFPLADPGLADKYFIWSRHRRDAQQLFIETWRGLELTANQIFSETCVVSDSFQPIGT